MAIRAKPDRIARLLKVWHLLYESPRGLHAREIAHFCHVHVRTTYRDLKALESVVGLLLWQGSEGRFGIDRGQFLPPLKLTLPEAMALFISTRLVSKYSDERDPNVESAFIKLACVLPDPIAEYVQETVGTMGEKREDPDFVRVFDILTTAWASRRRVRIWYPWTKQDGSVQKVFERLLDPYFIEPSSFGHSCYVIGYDHYSQQMRTFKIERIRGVELTTEEFTVPQDWSAYSYLRGSWGIVHDDEVEVQVRFSKKVAGRVKESVWHPSQTLVDEPEGTLLFKVRVSGTLEITPWLLSWGDEAEVLSPAELRKEFGEVAQRLARNYAPALAEGDVL